jgi:Cys-tRNA(Pro)/Cys-tRNA(Cys) deacylase
MLDAKRVVYTAYELPAEKLSAVEVAEHMGVPAGDVYKTIVVVPADPGHPLLVLVQGDCTVDLKKVARAIGTKKVRLPTEHEAEGLTGLKAGGISPLALINHGFSVIIDERARRQGRIHVSGGERGLNVRLDAADLARLTRARFADVSQCPVEPR